MKVKIMFFLVLLFLSLIALVNITSFYEWYKHKPLDIIIDVDYFFENGVCLDRLVEFLKKLNIEKIALDVQKVENFHKETGFFLILKFSNKKRYEKKFVFDVLNNYRERIFSILYLNEAPRNFRKIKYPYKEICELFDKNLVKLNFENPLYFDIFSLCEGDFALRSFLCDLSIYEEISLINLKIKKAIKERNCSIIYILPSEFAAPEENLKIIEEIVQNIKNNYRFSSNLSKYSSVNLGFNNVLGFFLGVVVPLLIYKKAITEIDGVKLLYFKINFLVLLTGILIWGLIQNYNYISLEEKISGIKIMFVLPLILVCFVVLNKKELIALLSYQITTKDFLFILLFILFLFYLILRTGNVPESFVLSFEIKIRHLIEKAILFRPRFKEIFFTHPLLFLAIKLNKETKSLKNKILFCLSILSSSSIVNTFLHVHTPLHICILRTITGTVVGLFFGYIYFLIYRAFKKLNFT
ncbi:MAG: DUF5693 family protein [Endomicrobiia bacterium]